MKRKATLFFTAFLGILVLSASTSRIRPEREILRPGKVQKYINKYHYLSVELNRMTGIPSTIIIAVAGLESDWGTSELARSANNHFGIKANEDWLGAKYCKLTYEYIDGMPYNAWQCFRKYSLIRKSYEDFGHFLLSRPNYKNLHYYPDWDNWSWAMGLQAGGYATDPEYAEKLMKAIEEYQLYRL